MADALCRWTASAAGDLDVKIGGGVSTVRQYLQAGLADELQYAVSPVVLGRGEAMFVRIDLPAPGYAPVEQMSGEKALHIILST